MRLLCIAHEQLERRVPRLALAEQLPVAPQASRAVGRGRHARLVTPRVPPPAHARHHLRDVVVAVAGGIAGRARRVDGGLVGRGREGARGGDADDAAVEVLEAAAAEEALDVVGGGLEREAGVETVHLRLEGADRAAGQRAHVGEVEVDGADLEVAAGPQDALALGNHSAQDRVRVYNGEAVDDGREEALGEGKVGAGRGVAEVAVVGEGAEGAEGGAGIVGGRGRGAQAVDLRVRVRHGAVVGPVAVAEAVEDEDAVVRVAELLVDGAEE